MTADDGGTFHLVSHWRVPGRIEAVFDVLADGPGLARVCGMRTRSEVPGVLDDPAPAVAVGAEQPLVGAVGDHLEGLGVDGLEGMRRGAAADDADERARLGGDGVR